MSNEATFHGVGLENAPVLDLPPCQTYPTVKGGEICGEPATLRVVVVHCPKHFPDDVPQVIDVCAWCWNLASPPGFVRHRPCGDSSDRDVVWKLVS